MANHYLQSLSRNHSKEHREVTDHACSKYEEQDVVLADKPTAAATTERRQQQRCANCRIVVLNAAELVRCDRCHFAHCLQHRHPEAHDCQKLREEKLQALVQARRLDPKPMAPVVAPAGVKGAKNAPLAQKVAYMKLKQKATGMQSIPATERIYFNVDVQVTPTAAQVKPFYFSKEWSFGRCVDYITTEMKLTNKNNVVGGPKLVLIAESDAQQYDLSMSLRKAVESELLADGASLQLKLI